MKNVIQVPKEDMPAHQRQREENQLGGHVRFWQADNCKGLYHLRIVVNSLKVYSQVSTKGGTVVIHRMFPKSTTKTDGRYGEIDRAILGKNGVLLLHKACHSKIAATPLRGFVTSSRGLIQEEGGLPKVHTSDRFDPNAYKLMKGPSTTSTNHHFWGVSLKQGLMGLMTPRR